MANKKTSKSELEKCIEKINFYSDLAFMKEKSLFSLNMKYLQLKEMERFTLLFENQNKNEKLEYHELYLEIKDVLKMKETFEKRKVFDFNYIINFIVILSFLISNGFAIFFKDKQDVTKNEFLLLVNFQTLLCFIPSIISLIIKFTNDFKLIFLKHNKLHGELKIFNIKINDYVKLKISITGSRKMGIAIYVFAILSFIFGIMLLFAFLFNILILKRNLIPISILSLIFSQFICSILIWFLHKRRNKKLFLGEDISAFTFFRLVTLIAWKYNKKETEYRIKKFRKIFFKYDYLWTELFFEILNYLNFQIDENSFEKILNNDTLIQRIVENKKINENFKKFIINELELFKTKLSKKN